MQNDINLYNRRQVYQLDQLCMQQDGQTSEQLMGRAAGAVLRAIQLRFAEIKQVVVFAGCGNNGGDAFALASMLKASGLMVELFAVGDLSLQSDESRSFRQSWEQGGGETQAWQGTCPNCDLIVDGLLGTGLSRKLDDDWLTMIQLINAHPACKVSIDIPSGLNADTGVPMSQAIQANLTVTFIGRKIGCFLADGPDYTGELVFDDLGMSKASAQQLSATAQTLSRSGINLPANRKNNSYKNQYGHVLVIGGGAGMSGAVRLAGMAALRTGAGLVSLSVHPDNYVIAASQHAELMVSDWRSLDVAIQQASTIAVGPGLGQSSRVTDILNRLVNLDKPMVIDADALQPEFLNSLTSSQCVITPHPGEAARLLACHSQQVQQDRLASLNRINSLWPVVTVLKGAGTLVGTQHETISLCRHGHAGMATAGMGDVLTGIIAGYLAQGLSAVKAAETAVLVHALAAEDYASEQDGVSLIASDVIERISRVVRAIRQVNEG